MINLETAGHMLNKIKNYFASFDPRQKLNVIYFISASKTRSFSVSLYMLMVAATFAIFIVGWAALGVFWLGSSLGETEKLEEEHRNLQAELFKLQNKDDAVYKEAYAQNSKSTSIDVASDIKPKSKPEPKVEPKVEAKVESKVEPKADTKLVAQTLDAKPLVKNEPAVATVSKKVTEKKEKIKVEPKIADLKTKAKPEPKPEVAPEILAPVLPDTIQDASKSDVAPVKAEVAAVAVVKQTGPKTLSSLLPKTIAVKEMSKSAYMAKVDSANFQAKDSRLRFGIVIKSITEGGLVGGGIRARLSYFKKGEETPTVVTLPSSGYDRSGKFLFLSSEKGSPKEIEFQLQAEQIDAFDKLEISLLSSNCLGNVEKCREAVDTAVYEIPLTKTKPLANGESEKEAG